MPRPSPFVASPACSSAPRTTAVQPDAPLPPTPRSGDGRSSASLVAVGAATAIGLGVVGHHEPVTDRADHDGRPIPSVEGELGVSLEQLQGSVEP